MFSTGTWNIGFARNDGGEKEVIKVERGWKITVPVGKLIDRAASWLCLRRDRERILQDKTHSSVQRNCKSNLPDSPKLDKLWNGSRANWIFARRVNNLRDRKNRGFDE